MSQRTERIVLAFILLAALVVRVIGLDWGLPYLYHPDEAKHVGFILNIIKTGDFNPHWFMYPSFRIYASVPVAAAYFLLGVARGAFTSVQQLHQGTQYTVGTGITQIPNLYLALRLYVVLFGVVSVGLLYYWGKKYVNARTGLLAALFLAFSPLQVLSAHWFRPDTMLALFSGGAVFAALEVYRRYEIRPYIACGVLIGLAASIKYNAAVLQMVPLLVAHLLARRSLFSKPLLYAVLAAIATFFVITPYALLDLPTFLDGFAFEIHHYYVRGQPGAVVTGGFIPNLGWYLWQMLRYDGLLLPLAASAVFVVPSEKRREMLILLSWPILVVILNATAFISTELALIPISLVYCVLAACTFDWLAGKSATWLPRWDPQLLAVGVLVLVLAIPVARVIDRDIDFASPDARELAADWIADNLPADAVIALEGYSPYLTQHKAIYVGRLFDRSLDWYRAAGARYLVASSYTSVFETPELYRDEVQAYQRYLELPLVKAISGPMQHRVDEPEHEIRIYELPLDDYSITAGDVADPWFVEGFYGVETDGVSSFRWTSGKALLRLYLPAGRLTHLTLSGRSNRPGHLPEAVTVVRISGNTISEHTWSQADDTWSFDITPTGEGLVPILLEFTTNTWNPSLDIHSADNRGLGFIFTGLHADVD